MSLSPALRKAAILISSLDARSADALLDQMGEAQARRVRDAVLELGDIDSEEQERIINEFMGGQAKRASTNVDGVELSGSLALALQSPPHTTIGPAETSAPFDFLADVASETVAKHLLREHPQTVAVVLAHVPPPRAAAIVKQFPQDVQAEVLLRVGEIDEMNMEVVREVARGLETMLAPELRSARRRGAGAHKLEAILSAAGGERPSQFMASMAADPLSPAVMPPLVAKHRPPAAEATLESPPVTLIAFTQLASLDDRSWAKILRAADSQVSLLALAGATPELVSRLLRQLPPRDAAILERKMESLGPLRLRDIEHAQQQLARIAAQLAEQGEIRLPPARRFASAA